MPKKRGRKKYCYPVECILNHRLVNGKLQFYVKWLGYPMEQSSWIPKENIYSAITVANYLEKLELRAQNKFEGSLTRVGTENRLTNKTLNGNANQTVNGPVNANAGASTIVTARKTPIVIAHKSHINVPIGTASKNATATASKNSIVTANKTASANASRNAIATRATDVFIRKILPRRSVYNSVSNSFY